MGRETIYEIACEMLQTTNIYSKDVSEIKYTNSQQDVVSLLELVKRETALCPRGLRGKTETNLQHAYDSIAVAMKEYLSSHPAAFSFRQRAKLRFGEWLDAIFDTYDIRSKSYRSDLDIDRSDVDIGVAIIKALHPRNGVAIDELADQLSITTRAVQKDLLKLDMSLYGRGKTKDYGRSPYPQFRLGGHPLKTEINYDDKTTPRRFRSRNTVHPLVLQENITELATILKALCRQFFDCEDDKCLLIALDIWYQMSDYAQQKIKLYFAFNNPDLSAFIDLLEDDCPDDHVCAYHSEKELLTLLETPMPIDDALAFLMKVPGRTGIIILDTGKRIDVYRLLPIHQSDGSCAYEALDIEGNHTVFRGDQVIDIIINS